MLKGAQGVLKSARNITWIIEVSLWRNVKGESILSPFLFDLFELFRNSGYRPYKCDIGWPEIDEAEVKKMIQGEIFWPAFPILFKKDKKSEIKT